MRIAGYGRVSTAKDAQLDSLENQIEFFSQYAGTHNYELYRVYADEGISGKQMKNRKDFLRMIEDAKRHLFDMVVVKDISRFARNTVDLLTATRELRTAGIEVQFLSNNQTILGNSEFVLTVFGALAQEESASLSKRVKFGKKINAQKGRVPNFVYGYRQIDTFHLEIVEDEAEVIRSVFDMYVNRGLGSRRICVALNEQGLRTRTGVLWRPTTLRRMMKNPLYCGVLETHKWETVDFISGKRRELEKSQRFYLERPELAVVSKEMWERAQEIFAERAESFPPAAGKEKESCQGRFSSLHLFSTMIRCEDCGYAFSRKHWNSRKSGIVYYWVCSGRNNFTSDFCRNGISLREKELIEALQRYFLSILGDKEGVALRVMKAVEERLKSKASESASAGEVKKKIEALRRREKRFKEMYASGLISMEELKQSMETARAKISKLQAGLTESNKDGDACSAARAKGTGEFPDLEHLMDLSVWTNMDLRRIVDRITVNALGETVIYLKALSEKRP